MRSFVARPLTAADLRSLAARWIDPETARGQRIARVADLEGRAVIGADNRPGKFSGLVIPYVLPGETYECTHRLRRDQPDKQNGKPKGRYLSAPGWGSRLFFPIGTTPEELADASKPVIVTEGEFKAIALRRAGLLAVALAGVTAWKTRHGDESRPIGDLGLIEWEQRHVVIAFDRDADANDNVMWERRKLTKELRGRGARVSWFQFPDEAPEAKGVDDLLAAIGPEKVLKLIRSALENDAGTPNLQMFGCNDSGNADRLIALYGPVMCYCHAFKKWLLWDGRRWGLDETGQARRLAKETQLETIRQASKSGNQPLEKFGKQSLDARCIAAMLSLAEPEIYVTPADLDSNPNLLNFLNGTVDLKTGQLRWHRRTDFVIKLIHYDYRPGAACDRWLQFLNQIMGGGPDAAEGDLDRAARHINFLQRALGYSLTGLTTEKAVFVPSGDGNNGKSTMLSTVKTLAAEYSALLQADTLMVRQETNNSQSDLADLRGARFLMTSETEEGQRLAQSKLKRITQGMGTIKAVRKYENPIEFPETHKLWLDTNRRPVIRDADDHATFNRLFPIPFTVTISKECIDRDLPEKLLAEAEGILAWLTAGAVAWFQNGLGEMEEIAEARKAGHDETDQIANFIEARCFTGDGLMAAALALFCAYPQWANDSGEKYTLTEKKFSERLLSRGYERKHTKTGQKYLGIALAAPSNEPCENGDG